ncbi:MAG: enoyl-CoA hydratase/isomerase [Spirochaetales bacterium]|nr:enoyl-CoA hydratase/isomerase [Spirochaetales bacterium]
MDYHTLKVRFEEQKCFIQIYRPAENNTINDQLVRDFQDVLEKCRKSVCIIIIEGLPEVFCFGADFKSIQTAIAQNNQTHHDSGPLYEIWQELATGPFITIAHVQGKANAGGIGFVAACDLVIASQTALFSLSELLFGIFPACVLPFLIKRIGLQKAHYMTLMTKPISVEKAFTWGLVDAYEERSENLLRKHLLRLRLLSKPAIIRYKSYLNKLYQSLEQAKETAIAANLEVFSDPVNLNNIVNYVKTGQFPWEKL